MGRYCNDYYEKFPEAIKLKCGYDLDYIIKYVSCKKNEQLQLQVSNICHVNNIFRTLTLTLNKIYFDINEKINNKKLIT